MGWAWEGARAGAWAAHGWAHGRVHGRRMGGRTGGSTGGARSHMPSSSMFHPTQIPEQHSQVLCDGNGRMREWAPGVALRRARSNPQSPTDIQRGRVFRATYGH
eukprot:358595-Chlamydomonas_euryale.AAC.4